MNNGRRYSVSIKEKTKTLRRLKGLTHREIAKILGIAISTAHLWTRGIDLNSEQIIAMRRRRFKFTFSVERRKMLSRLAKINLSKFWRKPYSKQELLEKIKSFYLKTGRIPLKEEFSAYWACQQRFGSWNNSIKAAGFEPNSVVFSKKSIAKDGHLCDSFAEKIIDDWLYDNNVAHARNFKYADSKFTADFFVEPNTIIEFFGLVGIQKTYDDAIEIKRGFCKKLNLRLIEVYPKDIKPKNRLAEVVKL